MITPDRTRYVIRKEGHGYFTEMKIYKTEPVTLDGRVLGHQNTYGPKFEAFRPDQASQFDTKADAEALIKNPQYNAGDSFANCTVEP